MHSRFRTYTAYIIGVEIAWSVLPGLAALFNPAGRRYDVFLVFCGFAIGCASAKIARYVYPPPKKWYRQDGGTAG